MALEYGNELAHVNEIAEDYVESPFDARMRGYMMRTLAPWMPLAKDARALQLGCFHGDLTLNLALAYEDLTVVDGAQKFLDHTRRRVREGVTFECCLFERYTPRRRFDAVFIVHVLEHLMDPVTVLASAREYLAPGGKLFLVVPNGGAASRQIAVKMGVLPELSVLSKSDVQHGHRRVYFLDTLERDVRSAGLSVVASGGVFFKPLANFQLDALAGTHLVSEAYMEGCYELGKKYPDLCASIFVVAA